MSTVYKPSDAFLIKAVPYSDAAPYAMTEVDAITPGVPCIIMFGGELTYCARFANHYIKQMRQTLTEGGVSGADMYSVYYDFGSRDAGLERAQLFRDAGHKIEKLNRNQEFAKNKTQHMLETEPTPRYIEKLYKMLCEPILGTMPGGVRVDTATVRKNASLVRMYAHSHGAAAIRMLGDMMAARMAELGFTQSEIRDIQQQIVVIQHGPIVPLEHPRFTTLSFGSASDTRINTHNKFSEYVFDHAEDVYPSYFSQGGAHMFTAGQLKINIGSEHDDAGLVKAEEKLLTPDGRIIFAAERNAIVNSVRAAIDGRDTPSVPDLASGNGVDFDALKNNGEWFYKVMLADIKNQTKQNPKHANQK